MRNPVDETRNAGRAVGRLGKGVLLSAAAMGLAVGGAGVASAAGAHHPHHVQRRDGLRGDGGPVIHGEWTTMDKAGDFFTRAEQVGKVAAPQSTDPGATATTEPTSISVVSLDQFTQSYAITSNTLIVPKGTVVQPGDAVRVVAVMPPATSSTAGSDPTFNAVMIRDITAARAGRSGDGEGGGKGGQGGSGDEGGSGGQGGMPTGGGAPSGGDGGAGSGQPNPGGGGSVPGGHQ